VYRPWVELAHTRGRTWRRGEKGLGTRHLPLWERSRSTCPSIGRHAVPALGPAASACAQCMATRACRRRAHSWRAWNGRPLMHWWQLCDTGGRPRWRRWQRTSCARVLPVVRDRVDILPASWAKPTTHCASQPCECEKCI